MECANASDVIKRLKSGELSVMCVPEEFKNDPKIIKYERSSGCRIVEQRGFDVISQAFFVHESLIWKSRHETWKKRITTHFTDFDSYYRFLNKDVYENACYTFCNPSVFPSRRVDIARLMHRKSFITDSLSDYTSLVSAKDWTDYYHAEEVHKLCRTWIQKLEETSNFAEFYRVMDDIQHSDDLAEVNPSFFLFYYASTDTCDKKRFDILKEFTSLSLSFREYQRPLLSMYTPDNATQSGCSLFYAREDIAQPEEITNSNTLPTAEPIIHAFFDKTTHYCEETSLKTSKYRDIRICRYFECFNDFIHYRQGDLTDCDLSYALDLNADFSQFHIADSTKLPFPFIRTATLSIEKFFDENFFVKQYWRDESGQIIRELTHQFSFFFDFVSFLNGDLSNADLIFCDGLANLFQWDSINFSGAKLTSDLCQKFGVAYTPCDIRSAFSFSNIEENEADTSITLHSIRDVNAENDVVDLIKAKINSAYSCRRVHYISDIHLTHKIQNLNCRSENDVVHAVHAIAASIAQESDGILLIAGDVSSDFGLYQLFVKYLAQKLPNYTTAIFTLGNHELWSFPGLSVDEIAEKYRSYLSQHGMYLLHNSIYGAGLWNHNPPHLPHLLEYESILQMDDTQLAELLLDSRYIILGGLGFSAYNQTFNANYGIYRNVVNWQAELDETHKFENIYNKLLPILSRRNTIILTHTPKEDWSANPAPDPHLVYVNGHTHRNCYQDGGAYRVYSDNQIGYTCNTMKLKSFLIAADYDIFSEHDDGIYEITREQYIDFLQGKQLHANFNRQFNALYMLKKNGYYCFIIESVNGKLCILNGGQPKSLMRNDVQYYYDNMDSMVAAIEKPLAKYTSYQLQISQFVRRLGGEGRIHGCIIDIDYYNHIYVNPTDLTVTGYYATDKVNKVIYPSVPALLESNCSKLYAKYLDGVASGQTNMLISREHANLSISPRICLDTDIYKASLEIKKMQKLYSKILTSWFGDALPKRRRIKDK